MRKKVVGTRVRPRLCVSRSHKNLSVHLVDDTEGKILLTISTQAKVMRDNLSTGGNCQAAHSLGEALAKDAQKIKIKNVVFDRGGYPYHGRVKALAEGARKGGLVF